MPMKSFEPVYDRLEEIIINDLPEEIEKVNKCFNDGLIIKPFKNKKLEDNTKDTPSFIFKMEDAEYTEKDRILENTIYKISLEIKLPENETDKRHKQFRYLLAIENLLSAHETEDEWQDIHVAFSSFEKAKIKITI